MPGQLVVVTDMVLHTPFIANWEDIRKLLQKIYTRRPTWKQKPQTAHILNTGKSINVGKKYEDLYVGPYPITQVYSYGNVAIHRGAL